MRQCIPCLGWVWQSLQVSESEILKGGPSSVFIKSSRWFWQTPKFEHATIRVGQTTWVTWQKSMKSRSRIRDFSVVQWLSIRLPVQGTQIDSRSKTEIPPHIEATKATYLLWGLWSPYVTTKTQNSQRVNTRLKSWIKHVRSLGIGPCCESSKESLSSDNWPTASSLHSVGLALSPQLTSVSLWWACSSPLAVVGGCSHGPVTLLGLWLLFLPDHPVPLLMPRSPQVPLSCEDGCWNLSPGGSVS